MGSGRRACGGGRRVRVGGRHQQVAAPGARSTRRATARHGGSVGEQPRRGSGRADSRGMGERMRGYGQGPIHDLGDGGVGNNSMDI